MGDRRLLLLRHTKSSWDDARLDDHDRPLAERGRDALPRLRHHLAQHAPPIDLVLCSTALRARQTLEGVRSALDDDVEVVTERELYLPAVPTLIARLRAVPDAVRGVLLVGHNPSLEDLIGALAGTGESAALEQVATKVPTGALADLRVPGPFSALDPGVCHLESLVIPKRLPDPPS